jgi:hypothetical protein
MTRRIENECIGTRASASRLKIPSKEIFPKDLACQERQTCVRATTMATALLLPLLPSACCIRLRRPIVHPPNIVSSFRWSALLSLLIATPRSTSAWIFSERPNDRRHHRQPHRPGIPDCAARAPPSALPVDPTSLGVYKVHHPLSSCLGSRRFIMAPSPSSSLRSASRQPSSNVDEDDDFDTTSDGVAAAAGSLTRTSSTRAAKKRSASASSTSQRPKPGPKHAASAPDDEALLPDVSPSPPPKRRSKGSPSPSNRSKSKASKAAKQGPDKSARKERAQDLSEADDEQSDSAADPAPTAAPAKKAKAPRHQVLTERDEIPKLWNPDKSRLAAEGSYRTFESFF